MPKIYHQIKMNYFTHECNLRKSFPYVRSERKRRDNGFESPHNEGIQYTKKRRVAFIQIISISVPRWRLLRVPSLILKKFRLRWNASQRTLRICDEFSLCVFFVVFCTVDVPFSFVLCFLGMNSIPATPSKQFRSHNSSHYYILQSIWNVNRIPWWQIYFIFYIFFCIRNFWLPSNVVQMFVLK